MCKRLIVTLLSAVCLLALANKLEAGPLENYWGDQTTNVYIGTIYPYGTYITMKRRSDGRCSFQRIGGTEGLNENYIFYSGNGSDLIILDHPTWVCGYHIGFLPYNGHYLNVHGRVGNDHIVGARNGDSWLFSDDGDDFIS